MSHDPQPGGALAAIGHDDYALTRVPESQRYSWINVAFQRFGQLSALAQFWLAASLGLGMSFWKAMLAITIGAVLLEIVTIFVGIAGMREGLSTSVLARWTGFGRKGSALVGLAMAISLVGWFAFQNEVFAAGLSSIIGLPVWLTALIGGLVVTGIVVHGFKSMGWVAYVTVPAFLLLATWSITKALSEHSLSALMSSAPKGEAMSLAMGTTMIAGGFIVGAVMTPDMTRFNRSVGDVVKQTVVGVTLGEYFVGVIGVLLAHTLKEATPSSAGAVLSIIQSSSGVIGVLILIVSIVKINDWNLYPSSLGVVNAIDTLFNVRMSRVTIAIVLGVAGSIVSAVGVATKFEPFLVTMGVLIPPIAGIMIVDYFILRTHRAALDESRATGSLPQHCPDWVVGGLIAWAAGAIIGQLSASQGWWGIPAFNSLATTMVVYYAVGKATADRLKSTTTAG